MPIDNNGLRPVLISTIWLNRRGPTEKWLRQMCICWLDDIDADVTNAKEIMEVRLLDWLKNYHPSRVDEPYEFVHEKRWLSWSDRDRPYQPPAESNI